MDVEQVERQLRKQVEEHVGRPLSDEEWETFKRIQLQTAQETPLSPRKTSRVASAARTLAAFIGMVLLVLLVGAAVWLVVGVVLVGLLWAYSPGTLRQTSEENAGWDWAGSIFFLWLTGYWVFAYWTIARVVLALSLFLGVIALAIGAIIRAAAA